jgi:hypothetical protein
VGLIEKFIIVYIHKINGKLSYDICVFFLLYEKCEMLWNVESDNYHFRNPRDEGVRKRLKEVNNKVCSKKNQDNQNSAVSN